MTVFPAKFLNFMIAFVNVLLLIFNTSSATKNKETIDLTGYQLTFADEFDGDSLDTSKWRAHDGGGVRKGGYWSTAQASVKDGDLIIRTEYKEDGEYGPGWYTCGLDTSRCFNQAYGYFECRCILPKGQGLWSAFWMTNSNVHKESDDARQGAELDIMESPFWHLAGKTNRKITQNIHYSGYDLKTKYKNVGIFNLDNDPYENYNTYGLLWTPDEYVFYINGREVARTAYGGVSTQPEYMIVSCEVDGGSAKPTFGWSGNIEKNDKATFSAEFKVDYVRAYQLP
ncbi:MAG: glycoside hydrolase family 16 protein [Clostridia bacterium]|nr:glycoside hydrolase family 16 protein [Clostridia bacterium]MBQ7689187.1 glycoside hydrolase family 16 protein [Clostridia bacterium]MBR0509061.1 glycoside hydrolase family 16 protein [Clostridia bacterium]MBR0538488.1 glycoside hydrolase family 16 protein [Clostridia bacterium]